MPKKLLYGTPKTNKSQNKIIDAKIARYNDTKIANTFLKKHSFISLQICK